MPFVTQQKVKSLKRFGGIGSSLVSQNSTIIETVIEQPSQGDCFKVSITDVAGGFSITEPTEVVFAEWVKYAKKGDRFRFIGVHPQNVNQKYTIRGSLEETGWDVTYSVTEQGFLIKDAELDIFGEG